MKKVFKKIKEKIAKYHPPKPVLFLYFFIPIIIAVSRAIVLDNDIWFLLNTGKYVVNNGFPITEPFTIHSNFSFIVQQWLTDVIFYFIHHLFGGWGLFILTMLLFLLILFISYKLCMLVSENRMHLSVLLSSIMGFLYTLFYVRSRPQMFDFIIFLSLFYCLETYIRKKNTKYLYILPVLSILLINLHASVWFLLFLFTLPYLIDTYSFKILCFRSEKYERKPLLLAIFFMFISGLINPYGIDSIAYIFTSYNSVYINNTVNEMKAPIINTAQGLFIYTTIFLVLLIFMCNKKKEIKVRYFLLFLGTTYLSLCNIKSYSYFITTSIFFLGDYLKEYFEIYKEKYYYSKIFKIKYAICLSILFLLLAGTVYMNYSNFEKTALTPIVDYMEKKLHIDKESKIYTMYDDGGYVEYRGYKAYIDPRAEIFLKKNNKKEDIFKEYYKLQLGQENCKDFLLKYDFDYLILYEKDYLYKYYIQTEKNTLYEQVYSSTYYGEKRYLYKKKSNK